jgi:hypothetical protein
MIKIYIAPNTEIASFLQMNRYYLKFYKKKFIYIRGFVDSNCFY